MEGVSGGGGGRAEPEEGWVMGNQREKYVSAQRQMSTSKSPVLSREVRTVGPSPRTPGSVGVTEIHPTGSRLRRPAAIRVSGRSECRPLPLHGQ